MQSLLTKSTQKPQIPKKQPLRQKNAIGLAQISSESQSDLEELQNMDLNQKLKDLHEVQSKLRHISQAIGKSKPNSTTIDNLASQYGVTLDEDTKTQAAKLGSNELIAHTIAQRVLAQISNNTTQAQVMKDLGKTKESLQLAQLAFYDKMPEAVEFLQLEDDIPSALA